MERLKVKIKQEIKKHCWEQLKDYNFGQRNEHNGDIKKQYVGIVAQSVVMDFFGLGYVDGSLGYDGGVDLTYAGKTYDVKAMRRNVDVKDHYVNNFLKVQENYNVDVYIFCIWNIRKKNGYKLIEVDRNELQELVPGLSNEYSFAIKIERGF